MDWDIPLTLSTTSLNHTPMVRPQENLCKFPSLCLTMIPDLFVIRPLSADSTAFSRNVLVPIVARIGTPRFRRFCVDMFPSKTLHKLRDIVDILHQTSIEIFESKKKAIGEGEDALAAQVGHGKDIISVLSMLLSRMIHLMN